MSELTFSLLLEELQTPLLLIWLLLELKRTKGELTNMKYLFLRGYIVVNEKLETSAPGIWALGDVNGGPQFTYISVRKFNTHNSH